jgi:hypothetical protein
MYTFGFCLRSEEEWEILRKDSSLILYDYPLNFEIHPGWYYSSGFSSKRFFIVMAILCNSSEAKILPSIFHEVIYEVFIPPD